MGCVGVVVIVDIDVVGLYCVDNFWVSGIVFVDYCDVVWIEVDLK